MAILKSVNVGLPRDFAWHGTTVHTAIWKHPVQRRSIVRKLNIEGDGQGDLAGHGGEQRAVMVYQLESYRHWEQHLGRRDFVLGQFGENFTVEGLADSEVCIGDRYQIGSALFEVSQPRVTCYRVSMRLQEPQMAALLVSHHRPGFYFRVLEEGEVGAGDEIIKVVDGVERMSVAEIDGLLYLPGHPRDRLQRALRIPALSPGWKSSFVALLEQASTVAEGSGIGTTGNAGLTAEQSPPPAWAGFKTLRVAKVQPESANVISLTFEEIDGSPLPAALPGQYLVLKVRPNPEQPPLLRNYSMSGAPGDGVYRVSVKREPNGIVSTFLHDHVKAGDKIEISAPRGSFTLQPGNGAVVLLSAGIGATPVLAMLHHLASAGSMRKVWWLYGARNGDDHPFAEESRELVGTLRSCREYVAYSKPRSEDRLGSDYDSSGHLSVELLDQLGVPQDVDFYLCGPTSFMESFSAKLKSRGIPTTRIHTEIFGPGESITPGIAASVLPHAHPPAGDPGSGPQVSFVRSGLTVRWRQNFQSLLELAEACDVPVRWSCRTGVCHSCESALIGGAVEYAPDPLEPPATGNVLICCARPEGDIEIDL